MTTGQSPAVTDTPANPVLGHDNDDSKALATHEQIAAEMTKEQPGIGADVQLVEKNVGMLEEDATQHAAKPAQSSTSIGRVHKV